MGEGGTALFRAMGAGVRRGGGYRALPRDGCGDEAGRGYRVRG